MSILKIVFDKERLPNGKRLPKGFGEIQKNQKASIYNNIKDKSVADKEADRIRLLRKEVVDYDE